MDARCASLIGLGLGMPLGRVVRLGRQIEVDRSEAFAALGRDVAVVAARKVSRPSHITVRRNCRLVVGSGRRNSDSSAPLAWW